MRWLPPRSTIGGERGSYPLAGPGLVCAPARLRAL
nr:MAG TPA: hypothetical protein [Caudoviricetes sp.]